MGMGKDLVTWCKTTKLKSLVLLLTEAQDGPLPFPDISFAGLQDFARLPNVSVLHARLSQQVLQAQLSALKKPTRIVVSGPAPFNASVSNLLSHFVPRAAVTILSA